MCTGGVWSIYSVAGLEIAVCHLPFSEQNMNMADQNQVGSDIWQINNSLCEVLLATKIETEPPKISYLFCQSHGSVLKIPL